MRNIYSLIVKMMLYLTKNAQIFFLFIEKVIILYKYLKFADIFLKKLAKVFLKYTKANKQVIKLK